MWTDIFLLRALPIFLLVGALMGVVVSLLLIFKPHFMVQVNRVVNRWISMRHVDQWLDRSTNMEQWFYQYHRPLGILVIIGAGYILAYFGLLFDKTLAMQRLAVSALNRLPVVLLDALLDALVLTALSGAVAALFVGLFLWLRPSMLRGIESGANKWVSSRRATKVLDIPRDQVEQFVAGHTQRVGWLLLLGSIYSFFGMFRFLV